jgi:flagellar biosynthesis protein FliQ
MSTAMASDLIRQALMTALALGLPLLAVGFVVGIVVSLIQIVTSIQDSSFGSVPRLGAFLLASIALLPWMFGRWMEYTTKLFSDLGRYAH